MSTASAHGLLAAPMERRPEANAVAERVVAGAAVIAVGTYCVALHALLLSGAWPTIALTLIVVPWLFVIGPPLFRAWRAVSTIHRVALGALTVTAAVLAGWAVTRIGPWLDARVDAVLYVENLVFFGWLAYLFAASVVGAGEPLVTQMARKTRRGDMPPSVVRYTCGVTIAWAIFFVSAMGVSTLLFFTRSSAAWSLFINVLLWPLVAFAMLLEYLLRRTLLTDVRHVPFTAAIRAFRARSDDA